MGDREMAYPANFSKLLISVGKYTLLLIKLKGSVLCWQTGVLHSPTISLSFASG